MNGSMARLITLVIKEILSYLRDPRTRMILIGPPIMQLLIFSFAATLEVKNIDIAVFDQDSGFHGDEFVERLAASSFVDEVLLVHSTKELTTLIDRRQVLLALSVPEDFSRKLSREEQVFIQLLLDGRRANAAQIAKSYVTDIAVEQGVIFAIGTVLPTIETRHWFNPNLIYRWYVVPSLSGVLAMVISLLITALSIARERELGTFDQLLVSPISPTEIIIGKGLPAMMIGVFLGILMSLAGVFMFKVPFTGNALMLMLVMPFFILSAVGIGLSISAFCQTQQQAILGTFTVIVPIVLTSGFATPTANMPEWLQMASTINPLRWYLIVVQGTFLKALPASDVLQNLMPMLIIAVVSMACAVLLVRGRLE